GSILDQLRGDREAREERRRALQLCDACHERGQPSLDPGLRDPRPLLPSGELPEPLEQTEEAVIGALDEAGRWEEPLAAEIERPELTLTEPGQVPAGLGRLVPGVHDRLAGSDQPARLEPEEADVPLNLCSPREDST